MRPPRDDNEKHERPFTLVPDAISTDTIECLRLLLQEAERGYVLGIAYAAMLKGRMYIVNAAGECSRSRTFARGMVVDLQEKLATRHI